MTPASDYTPEILAELEKQFEHVKVIHHPQNRGYGGALRTGFAACSKDLISHTDGDAKADHPVAEIWGEILDVFCQRHRP